VTLRINCCSGPRNISTALMYSFAQRADTTALDEPLYAHYLRVTGRVHPGRDDVLAAQDPDGERVVADVMLGGYDTPVVFFKQMAHHIVDLDRAFLGECRNVLLVREPTEMLASLSVRLDDATLADTGLEVQVELLESILEAGEEPVVLDATVLRRDPRAALTTLCERLGIGFDEAMLSWPAGPKPEDGVWAVHWYDAAHSSTGFRPWESSTAVVADHLRPVLDAAVPLYGRLAEYAITT
jgi:hypothetical protein